MKQAREKAGSVRNVPVVVAQKNDHARHFPLAGTLNKEQCPQKRRREYGARYHPASNNTRHLKHQRLPSPPPGLIHFYATKKQAVCQQPAALKYQKDFWRW